MKAVIFESYGEPSVLKLAERPKPQPKAGELLLHIQAASVNSGDARIRRADPWAVRLFMGLSKPRKQVLGIMFSATVEAAGEGVTKFKVGDEVFGSTGLGFGAYAEYKCLSEKAVLALKPASLSFAEASTIPFGFMTAICFLRKAALKPGQQILIYGASGAVGTAAVQLAKHMGAVVTAVCSTANVDLVKSLGADHVIDYKRDTLDGLDEKFDVVFDTVDKVGLKMLLGMVKPKGKLILGASSFGNMLRGALISLFGSKKVISGMTQERAEDLFFATELLKTGAYKPVVDKVYPFERIAEAHAYVDLGHKKGNIALVWEA